MGYLLSTLQVHGAHFLTRAAYVRSNCNCGQPELSALPRDVFNQVPQAPGKVRAT